MSVQEFKEALRKAVATRQEWTDQANCHGMWEMFDMDDEGSDKVWKGNVDLMRKVCNECPVRQQCLDDTMLFSDTHGFRAGMTARERNYLRLKSRDAIQSLTWLQKQKLLAEMD